MAGQAGHQHIEQLSVDKRQRIAQILGIWIEPQLLSLFGRGKCHIGSRRSSCVKSQPGAWAPTG